MSELYSIGTYFMSEPRSHQACFMSIQPIASCLHPYAKLLYYLKYQATLIQSADKTTKERNQT